MRRSWEIAGFVTIAAALHVSAAAMILTDPPAAGAPLNSAPAPISAGSGDMADLVNEWERPPEAETATELQQPEDIAEPDIEPPAPEEPTVTAAMQPPQPIAPQPSPAQPNLPEPPEPQPASVDPELPELQSFEPPQIDAEPTLALQASDRPQRRPQRPDPEPRREVQREQPQRQQQPARQAAEPRQATQGGGAGGTATQRSSGGGGGGSGLTAGQRASLMARWQGQLSSCLLRSIARTSGASGARGTIAFTIGRNGRVQGARVTGSTGNARVDREIARGAQRARCPAAPAGLTEASYSFAQPFSIR